MDQSMALRCLLQRRQSSETDAVDASQSQRFALIPNSVTVANLLAFVLHQLNITDPTTACTAKVILPGWKTLSLSEICSDTENTSVLSLLGNVSNIAVLLIELPVPAPPPLSPRAIQRLLRSLLPRHTDEPEVQVNWLRRSGCPMSEPDLLTYLAAPAAFALSDALRVDFAIWERKLRRLARSLPASGSAAAAASTVSSAAGDAVMELDDVNEGDAELDAGEDGVEADDDNNSLLDEGEDEVESGFGDETSPTPMPDDGVGDDDSRSAQATLERLSQLSRIPRRQADKENTASAQRSHGSGGKPASAAVVTAATKAVPLSSPSAAQQTPPPRYRLFIDPHSEIPQLERHFAINAHPTAVDCRRIADELNGMPFRQNERRQMQAKNVRLWFKNRRARARKVDTVQVPSQTPVAAAPAAASTLLPLLPLTRQLPQLQMRLPIVSAVSSPSGQ